MQRCTHTFVHRCSHTQFSYLHSEKQFYFQSEISAFKCKLCYPSNFYWILSSRESIQGYGKVCEIWRRKYDHMKDMGRSPHRKERQRILSLSIFVGGDADLSRTNKNRRNLQSSNHLYKKYWKASSKQKESL